MWGELRYADHIFIQIYFRMHHFVVKFSKNFLCLNRQEGIDSPNQNPADALGIHRGGSFLQVACMVCVTQEAAASKNQRKFLCCLDAVCCYRRRTFCCPHVGATGTPLRPRAGFKCVEALGRIIIRGHYPPSNGIIYMHLQS